jgi:hypothetical protein
MQKVRGVVAYMKTFLITIQKFTGNSMEQSIIALNAETMTEILPSLAYYKQINSYKKIQIEVKEV